MRLRPNASYWLKLDRAAHHLKEIKQLVSEHEVPRPCPIRHTVEGKNKEHVYRLYPRTEPDPWIAVVVGDFLFNLRSALDHLRVALVPGSNRRKGYFPMICTDIWEQDADGNYFERSADTRQLWEQSVRGMDERAIRKIDDMQPFRWPNDNAQNLTLAILSRFNNTDKHRNLLTVENGVLPISATVNGEISGFVEPPANGVGAPGAVILRSETEMDVEVIGTAKVSIGSRDPQGKWVMYPVVPTCETMLGFIGGGVVPSLEQYVLPRPPAPTPW